MSTESLQVELAATPRSIGDARRAVCDWGSFLEPGARRDVELLVSEIVTNSVRHGPESGRISLVADRMRSGIRVAICDDGAGADIELRAPSAPGAPATGGYGLQLVDRVSSAWGTSTDPTCVWFVVAPN